MLKEIVGFIVKLFKFSGSEKPWIVLKEKPFPGLSAIMMLKPSKGKIFSKHLLFFNILQNHNTLFILT